MDVVQLGDPLLRQKADAVTPADIVNGGVQRLIDEMVTTMRERDGVGLAAPQVGKSLRIIAIEVDRSPRYPNEEPFPLTIIVNPELEPRGELFQPSWEGCLSVPGIRGKLVRHKSVVLHGADRAGAAIELELSGFAAIVAQHEVDHLEGRVFLDRVRDTSTLMTDEEYMARRQSALPSDFNP